MFNLTKAVFMTTLTSTHAGSGSQVGIVDQPIQREVHTTFPKIEASSLKGCIKDSLVDGLLQRSTDVVKNEKLLTAMLGSDPGANDTDTSASVVSFTDARLLFFPVKSVKGVFAWITCPLILKRFVDEMRMSGIELSDQLPPENSVTTKSKLLLSNKTKIMLEEFPITVFECTALDTLIDEIKAFLPENALVKSYLKDHTAVVSDDEFKDFVNLSTEVITRIRINKETGIVCDGALFNEEYLPSETILYSLMMVAPLFLDSTKQEKLPEELKNVDDQPKAILDIIKESLPNIVQLGGNATLGKGLLGINVASESQQDLKTDMIDSVKGGLLHD